MKKIITLFTLLIFTCSVYAQDIAGTWYGTLNVPNGTKLLLVFHINKSGSGYTSTFDSPDQGANGLSVDSTSVSGKQLTITASKYGIGYHGTYMPDSNQIKGTFTQGPNNLPLNLSTTKPSARLSPQRPQDPTSYPYKQEEIAFTNPKAGDILAGTLTIPSDGRATRIVILITGSGPQNRNEELVQFNQRPFLVWSDWLTRQGIAVLRYDDRGIAKSTGEFKNATSADFADDAEAAVAFIKSWPELQGLAIGLMGHSEGGMIAPMVASRDNAVKFIVLLAGPGVPITQLMLKQDEDQARLSGATAEAINQSDLINQKLFALASQHPELSQARLNAKIDSLIRHDYANLYPANMGNKQMDQLLSESQMLSSPWFRYFIGFDPGLYLTKIKCPVLALDGTLDMQVNAEANLAGIKASLQRGGNKDFQTVSLPQLNHLFQKATTGSVAEYGEISETVDPLALQTVSGWINKL